MEPLPTASYRLPPSALKVQVSPRAPGRHVPAMFAVTGNSGAGEGSELEAAGCEGGCEAIVYEEGALA